MKVKARITTDGDSVFCGDIRSTESETSRFLWVKNEQKLILINQKRVKDLKYALGFYTDSNNILRLKGRLENISDIAKRFPIFLDNKSYLTELIILDCHRKVKHSKVKDTLNQLRSSYWIPQGRQTVKRIIAKCTLCKTFDARAFESLPFEPLPEFKR